MASDPLAEVHKFIDTMNAAKDQLQDHGETVTELAKDYDEAEDTVEEKVQKGFLEDVDKYTDTLETESEQTAQKIGELAQTAKTSHLAKLLDGIGYFEEQEDAFDEMLPQFLDWLEKAFEQMVENGMDKVEEGTDAVSGIVDDLEEEAEQTFSAFGDTMDELESDLEEFAEETVSKFNDTMENIGSDLTETLSTAFEETATAIKDNAANELESNFEEIGSMFTDMFENFGSNIEETATNLMEVGEQIFSEMVQHCTEAVKDALVEAIEQAISDVIQQLVEELVEQITTMVAGATLTGVIAEFVPALIICKNIANVINELLEIMNFGA